jgi:hypothetical protein
MKFAPEKKVDTMSKVESEKGWKPGQYCRAVFSEDSCEYEATIIDILGDENSGTYANIEFLGYLNQDTCWIDQIMESKGEEARKKQVEDAGMDAIDNSDQVDQNKIEATKPPMEKVSASNGIPTSLEKKDEVDHMGDNKIAVTKPPMEKVSDFNGIPTSLEKKDDVKTSEVCVQVKNSGKKTLIGEFNDLKKYITTIEDKASRIISEYQEKNKALAYELKESKDIQKRQKICEDILQDANDGLMAKNAKQNEEIKIMKNEIDVCKLQLENKLNEGIDETDENNNAPKTEGQKANTNADHATAQMGITSEELKNQTLKAMKFASKEVFPGLSMRALSDGFFEEVYQKFMEEVKSETI